MNIYLLAKKLHRILVLIISALAIVMVGTGLVMGDPLARFIHGNISKLFAIVLVLMGISGLTMYFYPLLRKNIQK